MAEITSLDQVSRKTKLVMEYKQHGFGSEWTCTQFADVVYVNYSDREILLQIYSDVEIFSEEKFLEFGFRIS